MNWITSQGMMESQTKVSKIKSGQILQHRWQPLKRNCSRTKSSKLNRINGANNPRISKTNSPNNVGRPLELSFKAGEDLLRFAWWPQCLELIMDARVSVVDSRCAGPPLSKLREISLNMALEESSKYYYGKFPTTRHDNINSTALRTKWTYLKLSG